MSNKSNIETVQSSRDEAVQIAAIYLTVNQFSEKHQAFPRGGLRSLIFNAESNGLAKSGAIVRIGRKVLIDEVRFFGWVQSHQKAA